MLKITVNKKKTWTNKLPGHKKKTSWWFKSWWVITAITWKEDNYKLKLIINYCWRLTTIKSYHSIGISIQVKNTDDGERTLGCVIKPPWLINNTFHAVSHITMCTFKGRWKVWRKDKAEGISGPASCKFKCVTSLAWPWNKRKIFVERRVLITSATNKTLLSSGTSMIIASFPTNKVSYIAASRILA